MGVQSPVQKRNLLSWAFHQLLRNPPQLSRCARGSSWPGSAVGGGQGGEGSCRPAHRLRATRAGLAGWELPCDAGAHAG